MYKISAVGVFLWSLERDIEMGSRARRLVFIVGSSLIRGFSSMSSCHVPSQLQRVGFIGLGNMGSRMANNLLKAGYKLTVHDVNYDAMKNFSERGIPTKDTPCEVALSSDVVITMLPSSSNVLDVYTGENGLLRERSHVTPWLFIDSSTIDPHTSRKLSMDISTCLLKEKRGDVDTPVMLDAPVSGGVLAAEAGTLTLMVGGMETVYHAAKPLLLAMGKRLIYCGGSGNGAVAKICNNMVMAVSMLAVSEAFALGQELGIKASILTDIFSSSSARCWSSDTYNPVPGLMAGVPSSRNYDGGFSVKLMAKDLDLYKASAEEIGRQCTFGSKARDIYIELLDKDLELKDFSCVFRHFYDGKDEA